MYHTFKPACSYISSGESITPKPSFPSVHGQEGRVKSDSGIRGVRPKATGERTEAMSP